MDGASTLQPEDTIVDVEAQPAGSINEKNSQSAESSNEPPASWPKVNQDGTPAAPDEDFQRRFNADPFDPEHRYRNKGNACDLQSVESYSRLARLSIAYYQHDLETMEKVLEQNGGVMDDAQLCHMRQTLQEYYAAVQSAREFDRLMHERRENDGVFAEQNLDGAVKFVTLVVYFFMFPVILVVSVLWERLKGPVSIWDIVDMTYRLKNYRPLAAFIARIIIAISGGMTLLTPMIILSLIDPPMPYRMLTVCLCVIGFSIAAMVIFRPRTTELLGIVGAYTAVLVVYVGSA